MLVNITGKEQTIKALEEARGLIEEARFCIAFLHK